MSANNYQFLQTRNMFQDYLSGYPKNLTYEEWKNADAEDKAALLYVTFYKEVTLAWYNAIVSRDITYVSQEDGVSTTLQYLMKNVDLIDADPNLYDKRYIYTVCYNCIGCLPRSVKEKARADNELSNEYSEVGPLGEISIDLWDILPSDMEDLETQETKEAIWNIIQHMGPKAEKVVNHLINPKDTIHRISMSSSERPIDRLADVTVSASEYEEIVAELKQKLAPFKDVLFTF